jgi:hypothetical protein
VLPVELSDLRDVRSFAQKIHDKVGKDKIDYLLLNAAVSNGSNDAGLRGSKWCMAYIVNHLCKIPTPHASCSLPTSHIT